MYLIFKRDEVGKFLSPWYLRMFNAGARRIAKEREKLGKLPFNRYVVINEDEPFIEEVREVMRKNGYDF